MKNMKLKQILTYTLVWAFYFYGTANADDTDIYVNSSGSNGAPYLMFMLDYRQDLSGPYCTNSGNQSRRCINVLASGEALSLLQSLDAMVNGVPGDGDNDGVGDSAAAAAADGDADFDGLRDSAGDISGFEASKIQALVAVVRAVFDKFDGINVGMMMPNNDGGGTILRGYEEFQANDANGAKAELVDILLNLPMPSQGNDYHESQPKEMHYEWYQYINGGRVAFGDETANNFQGTNTPAPDSSIWTGGVGSRSYVSPFAANPSDFECTKFYQVYATSGNEGGSDSDLSSEITSAFDSASASKFEDMMDFMTNNDMLTLSAGDQTLKSWFIQVGNSAAFADDWAEAAETDDQYMSVAQGANLVNVQATLEAAFIEALSVSTTFVAASVPVNVFNRIQTLDNFYIALFEAGSTPRWPGNIKKLKMVDTDDDGRFDDIQDALNQSAFSSDDGRIKYESLTYWTDSGALPAADPTENEVTGRDGRSVERGGTGQKIPGFISGTIGDDNSGGRQMYFETGAGALRAFNADNATATYLQSFLGSASVSDAEDMIRWARGQDVDNEDGDADTDDPRAWLMGDAIHSRPLAINFGATSGYSESNPDIRLYMGTNDGIFHAFENTDASGNDTGVETFAFAPTELMGIFDTLRTNGTADHPYGVDGEPVALVVDNDADGTIETADNDEVYVYFGLRRGGKSYYAMDMSDPAGVPELLFHIDKSGDFSELGMTFSKPRVVKVDYDGTETDALIFAGGYDTNKDGNGTGSDGSRSADSEGNAIYVVNARTGALIWKVAGGGSTGAVSNTVYRDASMDYSIASAISVFDSNRNGVIDRLYVGDLGGLVWRVDLPEGNADNSDHRLENWSATVLANVGSAAAANDRRFFHAPDVVQTRDSTGRYDGVVIGSGDRANPLETDDSNQLYLIKDRNVDSGTPPSTSFVPSDLADLSSCGTTCDYTNGWVLTLSDSGEKGLSAPLVADGNIFYTSYVPNAGGTNSCAPAEGSGKLYILELSDGDAAFSGAAGMNIGPGIPASPIAISGDTILLPGTGVDGDLVPDDLDLGDGQLISPPGNPVWQIYWRAPGKDRL
ncbi:MAG: hypothetical protein K6L76_00100 [Agarilytica sp.]